MTPTMRATRIRDEGPPPPKCPGMGPVFAPSKQASKQTGAASPMRRIACVAIQELQCAQGGRGKKSHAHAQGCT
ncbi:hypothetical protein PsYK624_165950 [Phanerochaete sordida]|uniref:Uncharacterized protein n=1 Tax=Phanerochaete sordida TaxID=48140 RepID=A0A9P3GWX1_9APHY|nr:hypothetical protein PsYK624_165950 [Phanerochaete sordida]